MAPTQTPKETTEKHEEGSPDLRNYQDKLDYATFEQILEMDDDEDDRDFSKGIVFGFFEQAEVTFEKMEKALAVEDFNELSSLGHFLKGSSATLGLTKVKDACEKIQHCKDDLPQEKDERTKAIDGIKKTLREVQVDYREVANILRRFFGEEPVPDPTESKDSPTEEKKQKPASPKTEKK